MDMKIKEILELSFTVKMDDIAKEHLSIGEKRLRAILKEVGCTHQNGKRGWIYTGEDPAILEKSVYDFTPTAHKKTVSQKSTKETKQVNNYTESKPTKKEVSKKESKKVKKVTYEIEEDLHDELKIRSIREKRNVSEIVNEIIKKGLR